MTTASTPSPRRPRPPAACSTPWLTQDGQYRYVWDEAGQLIEVRNAGNNALRASFSYDAAGRRGSKSIDGQVTRYMHDGINPIQLQDGSGTPQENLLAAGVDQWLLRTRAGQTQYFLADALGSTIRLTDAAGAKVVDYTYEPYGASANDNASAANAFQYTGRENDGLGLYYYRARYMKPRWGRFISPDPIGVAGGDSVYAYVGGNPIGHTDPTGEIPLPLLGGIIGGVSGALGAWQKCGTFRQKASAAGTGFVVGLVSGLLPVTGLIGSIAVGGISAAGGDAAGTAFAGDPANVGDSVMAGIYGAWGGAVGHATGRKGIKLPPRLAALSIGITTGLGGLMYNKASGAVDDACTCKTGSR